MCLGFQSGDNNLYILNSVLQQPHPSFFIHLFISFSCIYSNIMPKIHLHGGQSFSFIKITRTGPCVCVYSLLDLLDEVAPALFVTNSSSSIVTESVPQKFWAQNSLVYFWNRNLIYMKTHIREKPSQCLAWIRSWTYQECRERGNAKGRGKEGLVPFAQPWLASCWHTHNLIYYLENDKVKSL